MSHTKTESTAFLLKGQFLSFIWQGSKIKYLRMVALETGQLARGEIEIKLSNIARASCQTVLKPGDLIQVWGETKFKPESGQLKFKAEMIKPVEAARAEPLDAATPSLNTSNTVVEIAVAAAEARTTGANTVIATHEKAKYPQARLLFCEKSGCQRRGGKRQQKSLEEVLRQRGLLDAVVFQPSGCLGKCSLAPNVMLMPSKKRLSGMHPTAIANLIETMK